MIIQTMRKDKKFLLIISIFNLVILSLYLLFFDLSKDSKLFDLVKILSIVVFISILMIKFDTILMVSNFIQIPLFSIIIFFLIFELIFFLIPSIFPDSLRNMVNKKEKDRQNIER